jgi:hypothetical protein
MTRPSVVEHLHINADHVAGLKEEYTGDFIVNGIYFSEGDPERGGQHWNFTRALGDDDDGVCTVKGIQEAVVYEGITHFDMNRTGLVCVFDSANAIKTGVRRLTIDYQIDDATWRDLVQQANIIFTDMPYFKLG